MAVKDAPTQIGKVNLPRSTGVSTRQCLARAAFSRRFNEMTRKKASVQRIVIGSGSCVSAEAALIFTYTRFRLSFALLLVLQVVCRRLHPPTSSVSLFTLVLVSAGFLTQLVSRFDRTRLARGTHGHRRFRLLTRLFTRSESRVIGQSIGSQPLV